MRQIVVATAIAVPLVVGAATGASSASPRVGDFRAVLGSVNAAGATGQVDLVQLGTTLELMLHAEGLDGGLHLAHIHGMKQAMAECPSLARDTNQDGLIDFAEGLPDYGPVVRTLNGTPPETGSTLDYTKMFKHLDNGDGIASLGPLEDYAIVIHGVDLNGDGTANTGDADGDNAPDGVDEDTNVNDDNEIAMPALCGTIERD